MRGWLLCAVALSAQLGCAAAGGTLVSYVYYNPPKLTEARREWTKCATRDKLCACTTRMRQGTRDVGPPESRITECVEDSCECAGNGGREAGFEQCKDNLLRFLKAGVTPDYVGDGHLVTYVFNVVGDTEVPAELEAKQMQYPRRVFIERVPHAVTDLCTQGNAVRRMLKDFERFVLINCSARGPYRADWLAPFEQIFRDQPDVHLAGAVINCWMKKPHVQSWMWYADATAAELIARKCTCSGKRNDQINACELGVSEELLARKTNIASLQPAYAGLDFREEENWRCNFGKSPVGCSKTDPEASLACQGADLCKEIFVKYGGSNLVLGYLPQPTYRRVSDLEEQGDYCSE